MKYNVSMGMGHVTNSSSCIHFIPKEVLKDPTVQAFLEAYEIEGWVSENPWDRSTCGSILMTSEQQEKFGELLKENHTPFKPDLDSFVVVYGDEYGGIEQVFARLCRNVAGMMNLDTYGDDYN